MSPGIEYRKTLTTVCIGLSEYAVFFTFNRWRHSLTVHGDICSFFTMRRYMPSTVILTTVSKIFLCSMSVYLYRSKTMPGLGLN